MLKCHKQSSWLNISQNYFNTVERLSQEKCERRKMLMYIFRACITTKDGNKIYARDYGKKAFKIWVNKKKN